MPRSLALAHVFVCRYVCLTSLADVVPGVCAVPEREVSVVRVRIIPVVDMGALRLNVLAPSHNNVRRCGPLPCVGAATHGGGTARLCGTPPLPTLSPSPSPPPGALLLVGGFVLRVNLPGCPGTLLLPDTPRTRLLTPW
jgi:hypothetical protein